MFVILLFIVMLRFMFWLGLVLLALLFLVAAVVVMLVGSLIGLVSPGRGAQWQGVARDMWAAVLGASAVADNHRRWVLPNRKP